MKIETQIGLIMLGTITSAAVLFATLSPKRVPDVEKQVTAPVITPPNTDVKLNRPVTHTIRNLSLDPKQVIVFNTEVTEESVNLAIKKINDLRDNKKDIYILLDSPGGSVFSGVLLISYMEASKVPVHTVNTGMCASMCAQIFSHGATRYMLNRSTLMYHLASGGVRGTMYNMKSLLKYIDITTTKLDAYIADRAGMDRDKFADLVGKDLWIDAEDALALRLGDELATVAIKTDLLPPTDIAYELKKLNITTKTPVKIDPSTNPLKDVF